MAEFKTWFPPSLGLCMRSSSLGLLQRLQPPRLRRSTTSSPPAAHGCLMKKNIWAHTAIIEVQLHFELFFLYSFSLYPDPISSKHTTVSHSLFFLCFGLFQLNFWLHALHLQLQLLDGVQELLLLILICWHSSAFSFKNLTPDRRKKESAYISPSHSLDGVVIMGIIQSKSLVVIKFTHKACFMKTDERKTHTQTSEDKAREPKPRFLRLYIHKEIGACLKVQKISAYIDSLFLCI